MVQMQATEVIKMASMASTQEALSGMSNLPVDTTQHNLKTFWPLGTESINF